VNGWRARRGRTAGSLLRDGGHGLPSSQAGVARAAARSLLRGRAGRGQHGEGARAACGGALPFSRAGRARAARHGEGGRAAALVEMDEREREDAR
jgi:hypothetical protein